jgi:hypothetical protein
MVKMGEFDFKQNKNRPRKQFKYADAPERHQEESDIPTMLKKMQQQLVFLERKIDLLLGQSPSRPPRAEGHSNGFGERSSYQGKNPFAPRGGARSDSFGERSAYQGSKPFTPRSGTRADKPGEKSFFKGKKPFPSKKRSRP